MRNRWRRWSRPVPPTWCCATTCWKKSTIRRAVVFALAAAVRPGGYVSVLTAGRLGAVLGQTLAGRFAQARAMLADPDGRFADNDPLRRRYDTAAVGELLADAGLRMQTVLGVGVLSGLVSGAARQAVPGGDHELARLEAEAALHPVLREIAADLHIVARRPADGRSGVRDGRDEDAGSAAAAAWTRRAGSGRRGARTPVRDLAGPMAHRADGGRQVSSDPLAVDDSDCTILHVDMDAFYAMVEVRRRPELRGRPMMVAGTGGRGVVLSASYEARAHGIRSAMPTSRALALCRGIAVVQPDMGAYAEASRAVMSMFADVTPLVEPLSVDEAFLDISGAGRQFGRPVVIAQRLRARIRDELGLIATVGAASTKFVAKLASGLAKPDGLLVVPPADVLGLLHPLPVRALWGVGPRTAERLQSLGISTIGEIAALPRDQLIRTVGQRQREQAARPRLGTGRTDGADRGRRGIHRRRDHLRRRHLRPGLPGPAAAGAHREDSCAGPARPGPRADRQPEGAFRGLLDRHPVGDAAGPDRHVQGGLFDSS